MTIAGDRDKYPTADEREASYCVTKGYGRQVSGFYWRGMNDRDETDQVTMKPVGRMLSEGFMMLDDNDYED